MSVIEIRARLTQIIRKDDESFLSDLLHFAKSYEEQQAQNFEHETPEFFREMDEEFEAVASGKEKSFTHEEAMDILRNRKPIP